MRPLRRILCMISIVGLVGGGASVVIDPTSTALAKNKSWSHAKPNKPSRGKSNRLHEPHESQKKVERQTPIQGRLVKGQHYEKLDGRPINDQGYALMLDLGKEKTKRNYLHWFIDGIYQETFSTVTGKMGIDEYGIERSATPLGFRRIDRRGTVECRYYYKENIPGCHPKNPLGRYFISIGGPYGLHVALNEKEVERRARLSGGCVRMKLKDIAKLFYPMKKYGGTILIYNSDMPPEPLQVAPFAPLPVKNNTRVESSDGEVGKDTFDNKSNQRDVEQTNSIPEVVLGDEFEIKV